MKPADDCLGTENRTLTKRKKQPTQICCFVFECQPTKPQQGQVSQCRRTERTLLCSSVQRSRTVHWKSVCCPRSGQQTAEKAATTENKICNGITLQYEVSYPEYVSHLRACDSPPCIGTPDYNLCTHTQDFFTSSSSAVTHHRSPGAFSPRLHTRLHTYTEGTGSFCIYSDITYLFRNTAEVPKHRTLNRSSLLCRGNYR